MNLAFPFARGFPLARGWLLTGAAVLLLIPCAASADQRAKAPAQSDPDKKAPADELYAVTYDVSDIVAKRTFWDLDVPAGQRQDVLQGLSRSLLAPHPDLAKSFLGKNALHRMQLVNGKALLIHTDKQTHKELKNLVDAFRRWLDVAVEVNCCLFEVDRKTYDQKIAGKLDRHPGTPAVFVEDFEETEKKILAGKLERSDPPFYERLKPLKTSKVTIQDREQGRIFSWHTVVAYERNPAHVFHKKETAFVFPGFCFTMSPAVASDRRSTRIKLTQNVTELLDWKKIKALEVQPNQDLKEVSFEVPVLQESSFTSNFVAADGWPVVAAVQWQRPEAKDKVLVLVFSARIVIEEEERAIQKQLEEEKAKKK